MYLNTLNFFLANYNIPITPFIHMVHYTEPTCHYDLHSFMVPQFCSHSVLFRKNINARVMQITENYVD